MEWVRADDGGMATWTTVDNIIIDDDLSCRALGLLLRWLRRPPGVQIDTINQMIERAKKAGKLTLEGRDALYSASHELERAGYLVRELLTAPNGQHTWRVVIYARPVPPEKRSKPEDRIRSEGAAGRKPASGNMPGRSASVPGRRQKGPKGTKGTRPVPGNPLPGNPEPAIEGQPVPGKPDSDFQEASFKDSAKYSLSSSDSSSSNRRGRATPSGGAEGGREEKSSTTDKNSAAAEKTAVRPVESFPRPRASSEPSAPENEPQDDADGFRVCDECWADYEPAPGENFSLCADCR